MFSDTFHLIKMAANMFLILLLIQLTIEKGKGVRETKIATERVRMRMRES
jgi:hypothetical protein